MARDPWLDNVKMALVTLVVVGHSLTSAPAGERNSQIYDFIYYWHIPAFVLVTGYLSRRFEWNRQQLASLMTTIALPYLIFEFAMYQYRTHVGGEVIEGPMFLNPHWPMWYLAAVFLWRLVTPILKSHWIFLPLSVLASILFAGYGSWVLDLNRVIGLLPFFTLGLYLTPERLTKLKTMPARIAGVTTLVCIWLLAGTEWIQTKWLWYSWTYERLGVGFGEGGNIRLILIPISAAGALAVLTLVPRKRTWWTDMGRATMVVYLFHGFLVVSARYLGYEEWSQRHGAWTVWPTIAGAVAIAMFLAWKPVSSRLEPFVDPVKALTRRRSTSKTHQP